MKVTSALDRTAFVASLVLLGVLTACGGDNPAGPTPPPGGGGGTGNVEATVTILGNSVSDNAPRINVGGRVRFTNNDSRVHTIFSTPHGTHTDCPALNDVGILQPGQSRESGVLNVRGGCGFHDHNDPDNTAFRGQVLVGIGTGDPLPPPPAY
jgi:plastocyanin